MKKVEICLCRTTKENSFSPVYAIEINGKVSVRVSDKDAKDIIATLGLILEESFPNTHTGETLDLFY